MIIDFQSKGKLPVRPPAPSNVRMTGSRKAAPPRLGLRQEVPPRPLDLAWFP
jgi:hypothetical protein